MLRLKQICALTATVALGACVVAPPDGPSIAAMPPQGKNLQVFQQDDMSCRQYASGQTGAGPQEVASQSQLSSTVVGTVLGAGLGAAIGAAAGNPGIGAAIGAGSGAIIGTGEGANAAAVSGANAQQRYDVSYAQCMASRGNSVPQVPPGGYASAYPAPAPAYAYGYPYPYPAYYGGPYVYGPAFVGVGIGGGGYRRWR